MQIQYKYCPVDVRAFPFWRRYHGLSRFIAVLVGVGFVSTVWLGIFGLWLGAATAWGTCLLLITWLLFHWQRTLTQSFRDLPPLTMHPTPECLQVEFHAEVCRYDWLEMHEAEQFFQLAQTYVEQSQPDTNEVPAPVETGNPYA